MANVDVDGVASCIRECLKLKQINSGRVCLLIRCELVDGAVVRFAVETDTPGPSPPPLSPATFEPNDLQGDILEALEFKSLKADDLAAAVGVGQRALFRKPGGMGELLEKGLVRNDRRVGYWRPDHAPEDLPDDLN